MKHAADVEGCKINAGLKRLSRYCESPDYVAGISSLSSFRWFGCFKCGLVVLVNWQPTTSLCGDSWSLHKVIPHTVVQTTEGSEKCFCLGHSLFSDWALITSYLVSPAPNVFIIKPQYCTNLEINWIMTKLCPKQIDLLKSRHVDFKFH